MSTAAHDLAGDLGTLGALALSAILTGQRVQITHAAHWKRPLRWPTPSRRGLTAATPGGQVTHEYNPLHLLQYIQRLRTGTPPTRRSPAPVAGMALF